MSEQALQEVRSLVKQALESHPDVTEAHRGGRSTEIEFKTRGGHQARLIIIVKEVI